MRKIQSAQIVKENWPNIPAEASVWQGTASETPGVDPYAPIDWVVDGFYSVGAEKARDKALSGLTYPFSVNIGQPRVYQFDVPPGKKSTMVIKPSKQWMQEVRRIPEQLSKDPELDVPEYLFGANHTLATFSKEASDAVFQGEEQASRLWRKLIDESRQLAAAQGKDYFIIADGLTPIGMPSDGAWFNDFSSYMFPTYPEQLKPISEEVVGFLPGVASPPP